MNVFLSHAAGDTELAGEIADYLRARGFQAWDNSEVLPGDNWGQELAHALEESDAMVVLLTPHAPSSQNITYEVGYALGNLGYKGRLIPVLAAPVEMLNMSQIPWVLQKFQMVQLSEEDKAARNFEHIVQALEAAPKHNRAYAA